MEPPINLCSTRIPQPKTRMNIPLAQYKALLFQYLKPQGRKVALLSVLLVSSTGLQIVNPQILRHFIDAARGDAAAASLTAAALLFIGISLVQQGLSVWARYASEQVAWAATNTLREALAMHCLRLDMSFHNAHTPGELIERIDGDVASLANFFSQFVIRILGNLLLLAGILIALYLEDWRVGAAVTGYAVLAVTAFILIRNIAVPYWKEARQAGAELFGFLEEHLSGTEDIRASGAVAYTMNRLYRFAGQRLRKERKAGLMGILMRVLNVGFRVLGLVVALTAGYLLFREGTLTIGAVFLIVYYTNLLFWPLEQLTRQMEDLQKASAAIVRIDELYNTQTRIQEGGKKALAPGALPVVFRNVSFGYNVDDLVLEDVSFALAPGKVLGLLGRTGSGKTTVTRLLFRLYDPGAGAIRLGGRDIRETDLSGLRQSVGMVTQNVQLFRASVRDNLTFFSRRIPDERILQVIEQMGLDAWVRALPEGLDTQLESGGKGLSAGEAQLLTFARVFLKDPGLVILDEASSRLDKATEHRIEQAVDRLMAGRTGIVIAHRLETVHRADEIMILEDGRIREYGVRTELASDPESRFYGLLQTGLQEVLT